jgi:hypothetical protein
MYFQRTSLEKTRSSRPLLHVPLSRAALLLLVGPGAAALHELPGFFTESPAGVYETRGVRLAVSAGLKGLSFGGVELRHRGAKAVAPSGVEATRAVARTYRAGESRASRAFSCCRISQSVSRRDAAAFLRRLVREGDYVVAPRADPRTIAFRYEGVRASITPQGELVAGPLRQPAPTVLQGARKLAARYAIGRDNWVRFAIEPHDPKVELLIGPYVLIASAYFGGGRADRITAMAVDAAGYVYLAGATESTDFPSPSIRAISAGVEAYVLKIHPTTFQVVYATYLGGMGDDRALAIAVDSSGSAYVAGVTASYDFPAVPWSGGSSDGFLVRLNSSGALLFGRMLGGGGADSANAVALTPMGPRGCW